jgi:hypothetical protein
MCKTNISLYKSNVIYFIIFDEILLNNIILVLNVTFCLLRLAHDIS